MSHGAPENVSSARSDEAVLSPPPPEPAGDAATTTRNRPPAQIQEPRRSVLARSATVPDRALPGRPGARTALQPLEFTWVALLIASSLLWEGLCNLLRLMAFLFRRRSVLGACRRTILGRSRPGECTPADDEADHLESVGKEARRAAGAFVVFPGLAFAILMALLAGCSHFERELGHLRWTVGALVDQRGELESLGDDIVTLSGLEPLDDLWFSLDTFMGVTEVEKEWSQLRFTLGALGDWKSDSGALLETLQMLAE